MLAARNDVSLTSRNDATVCHSGLAPESRRKRDVWVCHVAKIPHAAGLRLGGRNDVASAPIPRSTGLRELRGEAESDPMRTLATLAARNDIPRSGRNNDATVSHSGQLRTSEARESHPKRAPESRREGDVRVCHVAEIPHAAGLRLGGRNDVASAPIPRATGLRVWLAMLAARNDGTCMARNDATVRHSGRAPESRCERDVRVCNVDDDRLAIMQ
jgi:hypothetical protein